MGVTVLIDWSQICRTLIVTRLMTAAEKEAGRSSQPIDNTVSAVLLLVAIHDESTTASGVP